METIVVECKRVEFPKLPNGELRSFSKEFATSLAESIRNEGLYNPIVIRPNPDKPGWYIGVQGRHRWYATLKVLKQDQIRATVLQEMDDAMAEIAMITENLWRNPLNKNQHLLSVKKWWEYWKVHNAERAVKGAAGGKARAAGAAVKAAEKAVDEAKAEGDPEKVAGAEKAVEQAQAAVKAASESGASFPGTVAAATGQSIASARRDAKLVKTFTEEELEVFIQMSTSDTDMHTIAGIKDAKLRGEIIALIASGMDADKAIAEVMKDQAPKRFNSESKSGEKAAKKESKKKAAEEKAPELSDDEWFETYCGEKAALFKNPAKFKAAALLFRGLSNLRHAFRSGAKKILRAFKDRGDHTNSFYGLVNRLISASHPKDWFLCEVCKGTGENPSSASESCPRCFGNCFQIKTETYL